MEGMIYRFARARVDIGIGNYVKKVRSVKGKMLLQWPNLG